MTKLQCELCGGELEACSGGRLVCQSCGLNYSRERARELLQAATAKETAAEAGAEAEKESPAEVGTDAAVKSGTETMQQRQIAQLLQEQQRLLAEIRLADGAFGPAQRRDLSRQLRQVERRLAKLQGRPIPFWWYLA